MEKVQLVGTCSDLFRKIPQKKLKVENCFFAECKSSRKTLINYLSRKEDGDFFCYLENFYIIIFLLHYIACDLQRKPQTPKC